MRGMVITIDQYADQLTAPEVTIYGSIYKTNPIVVVFREKESIFTIYRIDLLTRRVFASEVEPSDFSCPIAGIAPGIESDQIVVLSKDLKLHTALVSFGDGARVQSVIESFRIVTSESVPDTAFLDVDQFIPIFIKGNLQGVLLSPRFAKLEEFWLFLKHDAGIFEYSFDAITLNVFINENRGGISVLYVDYESIVLIQYKMEETESQSDTVFNIDFGADYRDEIIDILFRRPYEVMLSLNSRLITLWTPAGKYEYAVDHMRFFSKEMMNLYETAFPTLNARFAFVRRSDRLHHVDFFTGSVADAPLQMFNAETYEQTAIRVAIDASVHHLLHPEIFLVQNDFKYHLCADHHEAKGLVYGVTMGPLDGGNYFDNLNDPAKCPPELRVRMLTALNVANVTILDGRIEQLKEQQRALAEHRHIRFFTKEQDMQLLDELFSEKNYTDFAILFKRSVMGIFFHVKSRFGLPRCEDHKSFSKNCKNCQRSLQAWRKKGLRIVDETSYRSSTIVSVEPEPITIEMISAARKKEYFKRRMKGSVESICEINDQLGLPENVVKGAVQLLADLVSTNTMRGRSEETILFALLYIELKRTGYEVEARELIIQAERIVRKDNFKASLLRTVREIIRELDLKIGPQTLVDAFLHSSYPKNFTNEELAAICAYLRALDRNPHFTSGKARIALIASAIYMACRRIGASKWNQRACAKLCRVTEVTIRNRTHAFSSIEKLIPSSEMNMPVSLPVSSDREKAIDDNESSIAEETDEVEDADGRDKVLRYPSIEKKLEMPDFSFEERVAAFEKVSSSADEIMSKNRAQLQDLDRSSLEKHLMTLENEKERFDTQQPAEMLVRSQIEATIARINRIITGLAGDGSVSPHPDSTDDEGGSDNFDDTLIEIDDRPQDHLKSPQVSEKSIPPIRQILTYRKEQLSEFANLELERYWEALEGERKRLADGRHNRGKKLDLVRIAESIALIKITLAERSKERESVEVEGSDRSSEDPISHEKEWNELPSGLDYWLHNSHPQPPLSDSRPSLDRLREGSRSIVMLQKELLKNESGAELERYLETLRSEKFRFNALVPEDKELRDVLDRSIALINEIKREGMEQMEERHLAEELPKILKNHSVRIRDIVSHTNQYYTHRDAAREIVDKYIAGSPIFKRKAIEMIAMKIKEGTLFDR